MKVFKGYLLVMCIVAMGVLFMAEDDCNGQQSGQPQSASGVTQASTHVNVGTDGLTVEQRNIKGRLDEDNKPGSIKHLYVISPYSGQVIMYSTVKGKVTSGGKRLTPTTVSAMDGHAVGSDHFGNEVNVAGRTLYTPEVLQDDGTYGTSGDYLYWWDVRGAYHQHYLTGGQIVTISDQPLPVKSVTINFEKAE